jgi:hypothetical protein
LVTLLKKSGEYILKRFCLALLILLSISTIAKADVDAEAAAVANISIYVSADAVNGINPRIEVWIDGIQYKWSFGGDYIVTASNSLGAIQQINLVAPHQPFTTLTVVAIRPTPLAGLNVYLKDVRVNGQSMFSDFTKISFTAKPSF